MLYFLLQTFMSDLQKPIFLIGMPAVGKSTLGKQIAQKYSLQFIDMDKYIEKIQGKSISEIFSEKGEAFFRQIEAESLKELTKTQNTVIATGGGTPCFYDNMSLMLERGKVVFLDFPLEQISNRIGHNSQSRPMFVGKTSTQIASKIQELYTHRRLYYQKAHYTVQNEEILWDTIAKILKKQEKPYKNCKAFLKPKL